MRVVIVAVDESAPRVRQLRAALAPCVTVVQAAESPSQTPDDLVIWANPWNRLTPLPIEGQGVHVMDLLGATAACPGWGSAAQLAWCRQVARLCRGASFLLVGNQAEYGFWSALLVEIDAAVPIAVVPYAVEARTPNVLPTQALIISGRIANPTLRPALDAALAWAQRSDFAVVCTCHTLTDRLVAAAMQLPVPGLLPAAAVLFDLREDTPAERVVTSPDVVDALAAGSAVLSTVDGPLVQSVTAAGAGQLLTAGFADLLLPTRAAEAAQALARADFNAADAASSLLAAVDRARSRSVAVHHAWRRNGPRPPQPLGPLGHVLVLSDEPSVLAAARIHLPFGVMYRRGAIAGYTIVSKDEIVFSTRPESTTQTFDAIWVYRSTNPTNRFLLDVLNRPFTYDIDDNLLANPSYRDHFGAITQRTVREFLSAATAVSCATSRLAELLTRRIGHGLADRVVVTPNLAQARPLLRESGVPRAIIWASSDRPALTSSRHMVVRAIRDYCLAHRTRLVCIGAAPSEGLTEAGVELETVGLLSPEGYRELLRDFTPAIMVCPLETGADPDTQSFVDGKSDIKIIEALSCGLVGVFSRAWPYLDTTLPLPIMCDNTYEGWIDGLHRAHAACLAPQPPNSWPDDRDSAGFGLAPWAAALARVRLPVPLHLEELMQAISLVRTTELPFIGADEFDEEFYLANHDDIRGGVAGGELPSGYDHYVNYGWTEKRLARRVLHPQSIVGTAWDNLLCEVRQLELTTAHRATQIEALEKRLALHRALRAMAR